VSHNNALIIKALQPATVQYLAAKYRLVQPNGSRAAVAVNALVAIN
jgi:hypothetical protein